MKVLLHTCCAPCSVYCIEDLEKDDIDFDLYWYNPNIHPYIEYQMRKKTLEEYSKLINHKVIFNDEYGLKNFCKNVINNLGTRCEDYCYKIRLEQTAKYAKENNYKGFTTTLLVSPYQNTEKIIEIGTRIAQEYGLEFVVRDFKKGFRQGQAKARELGMYMQKYCGCVFSEEERYLGKQK